MSVSLGSPAVGDSSASAGTGGPDFEFGQMAEILRGRPARTVKVDGLDAIFVNDPTLVRTILVRDSRKYVRGDLFQKGRNLSRAGLLVADESVHRHYRRLANPFLRVAKIDDYVPAMRRITHDAVASWRAGQVVDIQTEMCWVAGAIALGTLFPSPFPEKSAALSDRLAALSWETIRKPLYGAAASPGQRLDPSRTRLAKARDEVRELLFSYIAEQLRSPGAAPGYLSALLSDLDQAGERVLTVEQVCDEAAMMLIAATVTTASVMSWALHVISEAPWIEEKLIADLAAGDGNAARSTEHSSYTFRFLAELLRLYPPVWISCRKARSHVTLDHQHSVAEGVNVIFSSYLLHRDPDRYVEPGRFDPDRWLSVRPGADGALYIPFGTGPKGCIGEPFAWRELEVILGTVLRRWRLSPRPGSQVQAAAETTLHPDELLMIPRPR